MLTVEIARVQFRKGASRMEIARAFLQHPFFRERHYTPGMMIETMRTDERNGLLVVRDSEAVMFHCV